MASASHCLPELDQRLSSMGGMRSSMGGCAKTDRPSYNKQREVFVNRVTQRVPSNLPDFESSLPWQEDIFD